MTNTITLKIECQELAEAINRLAEAMGACGQTIAWQPAQTTAQPEALTPQPYTGQTPADVQQPAAQSVQRPPLVPTLPPEAPALPINTQQPAPTSAPAYTQEQLSIAAMPLVDAGRGQELVALLSSFGAQAVTQLPPEQYGAFATQLRAMGAKI